jgi:hypothetical protein
MGREGAPTTPSFLLQSCSALCVATTNQQQRFKFRRPAVKKSIRLPNVSISLVRDTSSYIHCIQEGWVAGCSAVETWSWREEQTGGAGHGPRRMAVAAVQCAAGTGWGSWRAGLPSRSTTLTCKPFSDCSASSCVKESVWASCP